MSKNVPPRDASFSAQGANLANAPQAGQPELVDLLDRIEALLREGQTGKALKLAVQAQGSSPWATNAMGLCQLRLGNVKVAVEIFRGLAVAPGGLVLRRDLPTVFKTNYAAALFAADNMQGGLATLEEVRDETHPAVQKLRGAVKRWRNGLSFWQRLNWHFGGQPEIPLTFDFPLGDLR